MIGLQVEFNSQYHGVVISGFPLNIKLSLFEIRDQSNNETNESSIRGSNHDVQGSLKPISRRSMSTHSITYESPSSFASVSSSSSIGPEKKRSQSLTIVSVSTHPELLHNRSFEPRKNPDFLTLSKKAKGESVDKEDISAKNENDQDSFTFQNVVDSVFVNFQSNKRKEQLCSITTSSIPESKEPESTYKLIVGYIHICGMLSINRHRVKLTSSQQQHLEKLSKANWYPPPYLQKSHKKYHRKGGGGFWFITASKNGSKATMDDSITRESKSSYICPIFSMPPVILACEKSIPISWRYCIETFPLELPNAHPIGNSFKISYKCIIGLQLRHSSSEFTEQLLVEIPFRVISRSERIFSIDRPILLNKAIAIIDGEFKQKITEGYTAEAPIFVEKFQIKYDAKDLCVVSLYGSSFNLGQVILGCLEAYSLPSIGGMIRQVRMSLVMHESIYGNVCYKKTFSTQEFFGSVSKGESTFLDNELLFSLPIKLGCPECFTSPNFEISVCQVSWFIYMQFFLGETAKKKAKQLANTETKNVCCERCFWDGTEKVNTHGFTDSDFFECKIPIVTRFGECLSNYHLFQKEDAIINGSKRHYDESGSILHWELIL